MRVVIAEFPVQDESGTEWIVKLLGPSDIQAPDPIARMERRLIVELETPDDPAHEWYGADPLRFPLAALSVALTPLAMRLLTEGAPRG